ncbi:non-heme iron oxygenase ferredoxin subunit [Peribacillus asahii]|uniref:Non-heme iron oxygenase ferredoxin subunit n=1 Tax=Peribacillus asahii TaxID=228899 RepID=A0A398BH92_9BACI|nr:non-heme iron oxygenase ferredoxin subunit [Peribacillus asahii]RID89077.1 non-heme iron oxygenase ferredoxin subunit [Peribacillus asahii]
MAWIKVANTDDVKQVSDMKEINVSEQSLVLFKIDEGYFVTSNLCTHRKQYLTDGSVDGSAVNCPRHGGKFDIKTGEPLAGPCYTALETYPVDIRDDEVWIDI